MFEITNFNFNQKTDFENPRVPGLQDCYGYKHDGSDIIFYTNFIACPCIYYIKYEDKFCFSFDDVEVVNFAKEHNIPIAGNYENFKKINTVLQQHIKASVYKTYQYNLNYIELWKSVRVHSNGTFEVEEYDLPVFSVELSDAKELLTAWINKYKALVKHLVETDQFMPTITGGLDTRTLTYFYRDLPVDTFFIKPVKEDGKNKVSQGLAEQALAKQVAKKIGITKIVDSLQIEEKQYYTLAGLLNEKPGTILLESIGKEYIAKYLQHAYHFDKMPEHYPYFDKLMPFVDNLFLQIKADCPTLKAFLGLWLIPDLLDIPLITASNHYMLNPFGELFLLEYIDLIPQLKPLIDQRA